MTENRREIEPYEHMDKFMTRAAHVVSMHKSGKLNVMALLWKTIGELWMIPVITIAVSPSRYTFELLTEGIPEFTVNIPLEKDADTINFTGSSSGRNN
jgi:flavin reductase (DIM6/NTAB) family NADH-FMN oxidoreductase RutF